MRQLNLFAPREIVPDARHPWARRSFFPERADEWRCSVCGELASRDITTGLAWVFFRPRLRDKSEGWHWSGESHECRPRDWDDG